MTEVVAPAEASEDPRGGAVATRMNRTQRLIARRMVASRTEVPEFALTAVVDMDAAVAARAALKASTPAGGRVPSYNDMVVRACALALREHPQANGSFVDDAFVTYDRVNIGVAVAAPGALLVPTVLDADRLTLAEIGAETRRLAAAVRARTILPAELGGATFTVSNLGMYRVDQFEAVIAAPQAAILAVGALRRVPVVRGEALVPGHEMRMTLACDHRVLYGADGAELLGRICTLLEEPGTLDPAFARAGSVATSPSGEDR
jgi:pyruvate dehydrogenase E2 component (dihydrolipoamide acetyltransferase)